MTQKTWSIEITAPKDKIWRTLWDDATYRQWTSAFSETSYAVTDWQQGSKVLFLDGQGQGMVSRIAETRPNEFLTSDAVEKWAGSYEPLP
ncbi:MAG: hypothetical protein HYX27_27685 [Acidobacteria bacterium]|nr:hypothetical protein [Acidobacteriota bacterium]